MTNNKFGEFIVNSVTYIFNDGSKLKFKINQFDYEEWQ